MGAGFAAGFGVAFGAVPKTKNVPDFFATGTGAGAGFGVGAGAGFGAEPKNDTV